jgi:hypothetical protein
MIPDSTEALKTATFAAAKQQHAVALRRITQQRDQQQHPFAGECGYQFT